MSRWDIDVMHWTIMYFPTIFDVAGLFMLKSSPSGCNRFQPQIDRVKNRGTFLWTVISKNIAE